MQQDEINRRLVDEARQGKTVVRLKAAIRICSAAAEEAEVLRAAGIPFEFVPGVTAAMAAASYAGIPITHRDYAPAVALITGHRRCDNAGPELDYQLCPRFPARWCSTWA